MNTINASGCFIVLCKVEGYNDEQSGVAFARGIPAEVDFDTANRLVETGKFAFCEDRPDLIQTSEDSDVSEFFNNHSISDLTNKQNNLNGDLSNATILLRRNGGIGDALFVVTVADECKRRFPTCKITLAVPKDIVPFILGFPCVDRAVSIDVAATPEIIKEHSHIVHFNGVIETSQFDDTDYFKAHFERAGLEFTNVESTVFPPLSVNSLLENRIAQEDADALLNRIGFLGEPYVLFVLGTSNAIKTIHINTLNALAERLASSDNSEVERFRILCVGGINDREVQSDNPFIQNITGIPLPVTSELIRRARVVIGADTGFTQFAAAINIPTISLFGPTDSALSIEHYPGLVKAISSTESCSPCKRLRAAYCRAFESGYSACMKVHNVDDVITITRSTWESSQNVNYKVMEASDDTAVVTVISPDDIGAKLNRSGVINVVALLDNSSIYTGGGVYLWSLARTLSRKRLYNVFVFCDSPDVAYINDVATGDRLQVVHAITQDGKIAVNLPTETQLGLVIGTPPNLGNAAVELAKKYNGKSLLAVYETPNYIRQYRSGIDGDDNFWAGYKEALLACDDIWCISKLVKRYLFEWDSEFKNKAVDVMFPPIDNKTADLFIEKDVIAPRDNSVVLISRNVNYKKLKETVAVLVNAVAPKFSKKGLDPLHIHVIGDKTNKLQRYVKNTKHAILETHQGLSEADKWKLLAKAKLLVHPSTFEGYGIPPSEAMYAYVPVLANPLEVFREELGNNVRYFSNDSELETKASLVLKKWASQNPDFVSRLKAGRKLVAYRSTISKMELRVAAAITRRFPDLKKTAESERVLKVKNKTTSSVRLAVVSPYMTQCGIAETTKTWLTRTNMPVRVLASEETPRMLLGSDPSYVQRCWDRSFSTKTGLLDAINSFCPDIVHIEHEFSFFNRSDATERLFLNLFEDLKKNGVHSVVTLHTYIPCQFIDKLANSVDRIVLTKPISDFADDKRFTVIPLPVDKINKSGTDVARAKIGWADTPSFVVGSFGMWAQHKGFSGFLNTYNDVSSKCDTKLRYLIAGYRDIKNSYATDVITAHTKLCDAGLLKIFGEFMPIQTAADRISCCDVLVFNYDPMAHTSSSAAIRTAMSTGRPIICTDVAMFSEFEHEKHVYKVQHGNHEALVSAILELKSNADLRKTLSENSLKYAGSCSPDAIASKHIALYDEIMKG